MSQQELSGVVLMTGDFVKFPNPSPTTASKHAFLYGIYIGQNGQYSVLNVPNTDGTCTLYRTVKPTDCVTLSSVNGPANTVSNK